VRIADALFLLLLSARNGLFVVGPESCRAHPGPVCYKKGGHLAITDANLALGRILPEMFPKIFGPNEVRHFAYRHAKPRGLAPAPMNSAA
jgi:N-methylhydantoinase A/oxoprolinase/acetone carboxylase beta subunit